MWGLFYCIVGEVLPQPPFGQTEQMFASSWEICAAGLAVWWNKSELCLFFVLKNEIISFVEKWLKVTAKEGLPLWMGGCQLASPRFNGWFLKHSRIWSNISSPQVFKCSSGLQRHNTYQCPQGLMVDVCVFYRERHHLLEQSLVSFGLRFCVWLPF